MRSDAALASRVRGEYLEMPGLRLTFPQACRLWNVTAAECTATLDQLISDKFLVKTRHGAFVMLPAGRTATVVKALLSSEHVTVSA